MICLLTSVDKDVHVHCQFMMVTGGFNGDGLDSTEIFSDNRWRTVAGSLPSRMHSLRVETINNRVLVFGRK